MNNYLSKLLFIAWLPFVLSCQKTDSTPADISKVTVTFVSPVQHQVYHKGDTIQVNSDISYNSEIIGTGIQIIDSATDSVLFEDDHDLHTDHYAISETWVDTLSKSTTLNVVVTVFVANTPEKALRSIYVNSAP